MDYRSDILPPVLALGLSLVLHGTLLGKHALLWTEPPDETINTVMVQLVDDDPGDGPAAASPPPRDTPSPKKRPPLANEPASPPAPAERPAKPPTSPSAPPETTEPPPPPPPPPPRPAVPESPPVPDQPEPSKSTGNGPLKVTTAVPSLQNLLPQSDDLKRFAPRQELPDPAAAGVREATLGLGNEDLRYRGYLDTVHAAIDRSEKWKEAVLMGGGGGVVVVRMTITSLGQLVAAEITRSTGSHLLNNAALDAVRRARIPPFPAHWKIEKLNLHAQFNYQLVTY